MEWLYIGLPLVVLIILLLCCYRVTQRLTALEQKVDQLWNGLAAHRIWADAFRDTVVGTIEEIHGVPGYGTWPPDDPPPFP